MNTKEAIASLKKFRTYLNGKGKKYPMPGCPDYGASLDFAIDHLAHRIDKDEFLTVVGLAATAFAALDKDEKVKCRPALKAAQKVVAKLVKKGE